MSGANTYTGGTTVTGGTLAGTSSSLQGNIVNNAAVVFDQATNGAYSGALSGTGSLTKSGTGTLTLSGANTYTGGTTVTGGAINFANAANLGSGQVTLNGGGLQWATNSWTDISARLAALGAGGGTLDTNGNHVVLATGLSGAGGLTKSGSGILTLTGTNTYNGGTTINAGGELRVGDGFNNGSIVGNVANNGMLSFNRFDPVTFAGTISGAGGLSLLGTGPLTLTAANSYTGGTTIASGATLNVGTFNTPTASIAGNVVNDGTLNFAQGSSLSTFAGNISGSGNVILSGPLALQLTGANTYTGGTTINGGTNLFIGNGGTTGSIIGSVVNGGSLNFNRSDSFSFGGGISGAGDVSKAGAGTLTLSGVSTYTGPTTVSGGTLLVNGSIASSSLTTVNSGATLSGTGSVGTTRISSGGTLAPGAAGSTMTVAGNISFGAGSTYGVQATPRAASAVTVTGLASVQPGATLQASFAPGTYYTRNYTVLSAAGGRTGNFSLATTGLPQGFTPSLNYTPTDVQLILTANLGSSTIGSGQVLTGNQAGVANALNNAFNSGFKVPSGLQSVFTLTGSAQTGAITSLTGEAQTGGASAGFSFGGQFMNTVMGGAGSGGFSSGGTGGFAPSGSGRSGGFGGGTAPSGGTPSGPDQRSQSTGARTVQSASLVPQADSCEAESCGDDPRRLHAWIEGFGGYGWLGGTSGSSSLQSTARGMAVGAGWAFDGGTLGVTFATGGTSWFLENGLGGGRSSNFQVGLYGTTELGPLYLMGVGAWGQQMVNSQRPVSFLGDWLTANYTASTWSGRLETGHRFALGAQALTPFLAGQGIVVSTPGFCEASMTGSGAALCFGGGTTSSIRSELGLEGETDLGAVWGSKARLVGRLSWAHEYQATGPATAWFQALPGASFSVTGTPLPSDIAVGRIVSTFELDNTWALRLQADAEVADRYVSVAGTVRLSARW